MIKDVIRLKWDAGLAHESIAAALGLSKGAVQKYVTLATAAGLDWAAVREWDEARLEAALLPRSAVHSPFVEAKDPVGVVAALVGAFRVVIVHARQHDNFTGCVVAKEQAVLLEELGAQPMLVVAAERVASAVLRPHWVLRDDVERQLGDCRQSLAGVLPYVPDRVFLLEGLDLLHQCFNLCEEQRVGENRPAVND